MDIKGQDILGVNKFTACDESEFRGPSMLTAAV